MATSGTPPAYRNKHFATAYNKMGSDQSAVRSWPCHLGAFFIEPYLFDNNVPFDNNTTIYMINLL